jgi:hypothetical protein
MTPRTSNKADRIFVQNGRRLYRRRFSSSETRFGIAIVIVLASIFSWVAWKGAHPDPALFMLDTDLSQLGTSDLVDRGPMPADLASEGWQEGALSEYGYDNLYVKINGREGYYKSFGFERLHFLSIVSTEDPQTAVDIELYNLGNAANAVGAYAGERSPDATPSASESGLTHIDRNALYLTHGRFYLRAIGSAESPVVRAQLEHLRDRFKQELPSEPLPWGYNLFVTQLGMDPGSVAFILENAFSFGFARNVYSATLDDGAELFVTPAGSEAGAADLVSRFLDGFHFIKDRYLDTFATVTAAGEWVVGVHRATETRGAFEAVNRLAGVVKDMPLPADTSEPTTTRDVEEAYETDE